MRRRGAPVPAADDGRDLVNIDVDYGSLAGKLITSPRFAGVALVRKVVDTTKHDAADSTIRTIYLRRPQRGVPMDPDFIYSADKFAVYDEEQSADEEAPAPKRRRAKSAADLARER